MRSHPADTLVSLGGQRVARAASSNINGGDPERRAKALAELAELDAEAIDVEATAKKRWVREADALYDAMLFPDEPGEPVRIEDLPASEAEAWKDLVEALPDYGPRHPAKPRPLSDRMNVCE